MAILFVLAIVAPASAGAGPTRLSDGSASPGSGTTLTTIAFTVTYRNREGSPADWVRVRIAGDTHAMSSSGSDWKHGVGFQWAGKLPPGTHTVTFEAMGRDKFSASLGGGSVTITLPPTPAPTPAPTPKPSPKPTPKPTPKATAEPTTKPTPKPTAAPTPRATAAPRATTRPDPTPSRGPSPAPTADSTAAPSPAAGATTSPAGPTAGASATPASVPSAAPSDPAVAYVPGNGSPGDGTPRAPTPDGGRGTEPGPLDGLASAMARLDGARPVLPLGLVATLVTTTGVVGAAMAFGVFGKRRRDGEAPADDEVLAAQAASGLSADAYGFADRPAADAAAAALLADPELAMPRWRRPSLLEARRADPVRDAPTAAPRLTFDHGLVGALDGRERRFIGYNVVRLLDTPDELRGAEIGFLDQGDEVQLLEKRGVYWLVLCPDGRQGWIHKMTLGEVVGEPPVMSAPTATMPIAAETWTMGDDVDGDVLTAYLESRRRA